MQVSNNCPYCGKEVIVTEFVLCKPIEVTDFTIKNYDEEEPIIIEEEITMDVEEEEKPEEDEHNEDSESE